MYYILFAANFRKTKTTQTASLPLKTRFCAIQKVHKATNLFNIELFSMKNLQISIFFCTFVPAIKNDIKNRHKSEFILPPIRNF